MSNINLPLLFKDFLYNLLERVGGFFLLVSAGACSGMSDNERPP